MQTFLFVMGCITAYGVLAALIFRWLNGLAEHEDYGYSTFMSDDFSAVGAFFWPALALPIGLVRWLSLCDTRKKRARKEAEEAKRKADAEFERMRKKAEEELAREANS